MSYGFGGGPPQQGGYPPQSNAYPPQGGYPPAATGGPYPPAPTSGGYPPPTGYGAPPIGFPQSSAPYAPPTGMYPAANAPYGPGPTGGIGFENIASRPNPIPQQPAQNYGFNPSQPSGYGSYPAPPPPGGGYPPQVHAAPPQVPPQSHSSYGQQPYTQPYRSPVPPTAPTQSTPYMPQSQNSYAGMSAQSSQYTARPKTQGTLKPATGFNPESDARALRKAMKGLGTDEKAIINILGFRSNQQRLQIKNYFKQSFGRDLIKDLKSELSGNFEELCCGLMMEPREFDAFCLYKAMDGAGTTESTLIEILTSRSNSEIREIKDWYTKMYKRNLEKDLISETSGHFRKLLVSLNNASRDESYRTDVTSARNDARSLYEAGEKRWGTDEAAFNLVMSTRNYAQLNLIFAEYQKIAHRDIIKSIQSEFSGDVEDGMCAVVDIARNAPAYFAKRLHKSMKGLGTNDTALIRVVISRCEVDMVQIKEQFRSLYKQNLSSFISGDTSGDYKKLLLALVGH